MSGIKADATPPGWARRYDISASDHALLFYSREAEPHYEVRFRHVCDRGDRGTIICAPQLTASNRPGGHQIAWDDDRPTVHGSILCTDCGTHGFIRDGRWVPA